MKKNIFLLLFAVFAQTVFAQNLLNIKSPEKFREEQEKLKAPKTTKSVMVEGEIQEVPLTPEELAAAKPTLKEKPVAFAPVEDKDILWSKVVWEVIDLNEKINQPFYYKSESTVDNFVSLYDALVDGMESGAIKEVYDDDSFVGRLEQKDFIMRTSRVDTTDYAINKINAGKTLEAGDLDYVKLNSNSVRLVKIMGMWYIDKRIGELRYRLLGIAPMGPDIQNDSQIDEEGYVDLFWVWYADVRDYLHQFKVFNPRNSSSKLAFDDLLDARRFHSVIYKSQGGVGTGKIEEYLPADAQAQIEESNRIKQSILQMETDMWNY